MDDTRKPLGFWSTAWARRRVINEAYGEAEAASYGVEQLQGQVKRLTAEVLQLRAMFMGVVEVLHAKAPFDDAELERATEGAIAHLKAQHAPGPLASGAPTVACDRCKTVVAVWATTVTLDGVLCDRCAG